MHECYLPELRSMNKDSNSFRNSGAYTSPGTPEYEDIHHGGFQKGWWSERVPLPRHGDRRRTSASVLMPFNNGRTLPSKWDDAERWITSPVSGSGLCRTLAQPPQRRPKSKSGPLGPTPGATYFPNYSPGFPLLEGGSTKNFLIGSPLTTGVLVPNGYAFHQAGIINEHSVPDHTEYRSAGVPGWPELLIESSYLDSQDEKIDENNITCVVSRRDMATQMSPVESPDSSPKGSPLLSNSPPRPSPVEPRSHHSTRVEVRDVQVDKRVTVTRQQRGIGNNESTEIKDLALTWNPTECAIELSKLQKEEARIAAWENLQHAKAEASIRKLEMELEKKKSASMDKIMKKLRVAQMKAQEMRKTISVTAGSQAPKTSPKVISLCKYPKISLICCFSSHHN